MWPTHRGDHRAANRSFGAAPRHGRVRARFAAREGTWLRPALVDAEGNVFVYDGETVTILDRAGAVRRSFPAALGGFGAVGHEGIVGSREGEVACYTPAGEVAWSLSFAGTVEAIHRAANGDIVVHTLERRPDAIELGGRVARIGPGGRVVFTSRMGQKLVGYVREPRIAFDDDGVLFTLARGRIGDGVSGDDRIIGGVAAYYATGAVRFVVAPDAWMTDFYGLASGVVVGGRAPCRVAATGDVEPLPERGREREPVHVFDEAFVVDLHDVALVTRREGNVSRILQAVADPEGNLTFVSEDRLLAVTSKLEPRWSLDLRAFQYGSIGGGPDDTVIVVSRNELVIVE